MRVYSLQGSKVSLSSDLSSSLAPEIADLANDREISRNLGSHSFPYPYTVEDALAFFNRNREEGRKFFAIDFIIFHSGHPAGIIGLSDIDHNDHKCHVGYWIGKKYRGMGLATEALSLVTGFAHDDLSMHRIYTGVFEFNTASMSVLLKNGYSVEGIERETYFMEGKYWSSVRFSRIFS